jgi:hypothetical protein
MEILYRLSGFRGEDLLEIDQLTEILLKVALDTIPKQPIYKLLIYTVFYFITFQVNLVNWLVR